MYIICICTNIFVKLAIAVQTAGPNGQKFYFILFREPMSSGDRGIILAKKVRHFLLKIKNKKIKFFSKIKIFSSKFRFFISTDNAGHLT